jgi:endonuclease V-like protein UPF0215 family
MMMIDGELFSKINVDLKSIANATRLPTIMLSNERLPSQASRLYRWRGGFFYVVGMGVKKAKSVLEISTVESDVPEPIRASRLIAKGLEKALKVTRQRIK